VDAIRRLEGLAAVRRERREERGRHRGNVHRGNRIGHLGELVFAADLLGEDLAVAVIVARRQALLGDGRTVVIARHVGLEAALALAVVGTRGEAERRAAVDDEEAERLLGLNVPGDLLGQVRRPPVPLAPVAQPAGIGFGREDGHAGIGLARGVPVLFARTGVHAHGDLGVGIRQVAVEPVAHAVGHVERAEPEPLQQVLVPDDELGRTVGRAPAAVFVLDLGQHDRTAVLPEEGTRDLADGRQIALALLQVFGILRRADQVTLLREHPERQPAVVPFAAAVRARTEEDLHALGMTELQEAGDIAVAGREVERPVGALEVIPEEIARDGVEAHGLHHPNAVLPVFARDALGVYLAGPEQERLAVHQNVLAAELDRRRGDRRGCARHGQQRTQTRFHQHHVGFHVFSLVVLFWNFPVQSALRFRTVRRPAPPGPRT